MKIKTASMIINSFFWCGVLLVWALVILGTLWIMGYQPQISGQSVSDEEIIRMTVCKALRVIEVAPPAIINQIAQTGHPKPDSLIPYRDVDHFLDENPNCCPIEIKRGYTDKIVGVSGKVFYRAEDGQINSSEPILLLNGQHYPAKLYQLP